VPTLPLPLIGPPKGSFLDGLFRRFGIPIPPCSRLSSRAVDSWFEDFNRLADWRHAATENQPIETGPKVAALLAELAEARWERDALQRSTSWRITRPLRIVAQMLRGSANTAE
jgi:hypothetical protein